MTFCSDRKKAVLKQPQSKRFARFENGGWVAQRLDCGRFTAAFLGSATSITRLETGPILLHQLG